MVHKVFNFNKTDCKHFTWSFSRACCGRGTVKSGACQIPDKDGRVTNKVCSTKMPYCQYEKREEQ